jgi:hypothetical protein
VRNDCALDFRPVGASGTRPKPATMERWAIIAIVWPPTRAPILIAVYLADAIAPSPTLKDAFAEVARLIVGTF